MSDPGQRARVAWIAAAVTAAVGIGSAALLALHVDWAAGPPWFRWPYDSLPALELWPLLLVAFAPVAWALHRARSSPDGFAIAALVLGAATLAVVAQGVRAHGPALDRATWILEDPRIHGYLTTARALCDDPAWLADFPAHSPAQGVHVRVHPPGLVGSYCLLGAAVGFGPALPVLAAILLWAIAALAPLVTYRLGLALGIRPRAALLGAACLALSPAPAAFCPSFDAIWPTVIAGLYLAWRRAVSDGGSLGAAALAGALVWIALGSSYVLAAAALPLLVIAAAELRADGGGARVARAAGAAVGVFAALTLALYLGRGLDQLAVLAQALDNQAENTARWFSGRSWPDTIGWDLLDLGRAMPWPLAVPALLGAGRDVGRGEWTWPALAWLLPLLAALGGQITTETFRTWMFMLPPLALIAGRELAGWPARPRLVALASAALVSGAVIQHHAVVWS